MNQRLVSTLAISLGLHAVLLWWLPPPILKTMSQTQPETVQLTLNRLEEEKGPRGNQPLKPSKNTADEKTAEKETASESKKSPEEEKSAGSPEEEVSNEKPESRGNEALQSESRVNRNKTGSDVNVVEESPDKTPTRAGSDESVSQTQDQSSHQKLPEAESPTRSGEVVDRETKDPDEERTYDLLQHKGSFSRRESNLDKSYDHARADQVSGPVVSGSFRRIKIDQSSSRVKSQTSGTKTVVIHEPEGKNGETNPVSIPEITLSKGGPESSEMTVSRSTTRSSGWITTQRDLLKRPLPDVPDWLERRGVDVSVVTRYTITEQGDVTSIKVLRSTGFPELDNRVVSSLSEWKYETGPRKEHQLKVFRFMLK